jgi:rhodanese-related sulfurtransferase
MEAMGLLDFLSHERRYGPFVPEAEAAAMLDRGGLVLDVRSRREWEAGHCAESLLVPMDELQARLGELPRDAPILVCCAVGGRARQAADFLRGQGYDAHNLGGWERNPRHRG